MSGGGGGGGTSGLGGSGEVSDCMSLVFRTALNSPEPDVLADLKEDDSLEIVQQEGDRRILARATDGRIAGSVTSSQVARLLRCLNEGVEYVAIVLSIDDGSCQLEVRPKANQ